MIPGNLQPDQFQAYPTEARDLAVKHIQLLRRLPVAFVPLLLREVIAYDHKFPVERSEMDDQFRFLESMTPEQLHATMRVFAQLHVAPEVERLDWVNSPADFSEQLTAHLWATHQIDTFRAAAVEYVAKMNASRVEDPLPTHRLGVAVIGKGVTSSGYPLFRKLRSHGVYYKAVAARDGYTALLTALTKRAAQYPVPFSHWHIDGGVLDSPAPMLTEVSYAALISVRSQLQMRIQKAYETSMGSESLRTALARMRPEDVGLAGTGPDAALNHFQLSLLTEGSGTQIFSTTFVQWAAREALRRAQPLTLLAHFTPRQRQDSTQEMLLETRRKPTLDPEGSLVDADMAAYYTWLNQQRLTGASEARFLVWFENHQQALAISPHLPKGRESTTPVELAHLIADLC